MQYPQIGFDYVPSYQLPGVPWVTSSNIGAGSTLAIHFPKITKSFRIVNYGPGAMQVAFTQNGLAAGNFFSLFASGSISTEMRVKDLYIKAPSGSLSYDMLVGLTLIDQKMVCALTGTTWSGVG